VPPEDVIGAFRVGSGKILPGSYVASPTHRLLTARGFFQLSPALWECLQREIAERA
jgi:hypothetical protein